MAPALQYTKHQYGGKNDLQVVGVWDVDSTDKSKLWVIYIHGGAWRDPRIAHETLQPTIDKICSGDDGSKSESECKAKVAAFASLDYRLSPHPDFPQDLSQTPTNQYRTARHPDHLDDVRLGLAFLQNRYAFGSNYILVGHSAGATLAFQVLADPTEAGVSVIPPKTIIGVSGIYDFSAIDARSGGAYAPFLSAAFGEPGGWDSVAPMKFPDNFADAWKQDGNILLGWSKDDELIDEHEIDNMALKLQNQGYSINVFKDMSGSHDECWESGAELARLIGYGLAQCKF